MYKLIACDLDETLLSTDKHVSKGNADAIKRLRDYGVKFVLATGRGFNTVQGTLEEVGLKDLENEYVMSYNGGAITENKGNRILHFEGISFELASALYKKGITYSDVCTHVYTKDKVYCYNFFEAEQNYLRGKQPMNEIFIDNIDFLKDDEIVKVIYTNEDYDYLTKIAKEVEYLTGDCDVSYSANRYLEFNHKGVNKGEGLRRIAKMLNIDIKDTIAVGDNFNDLPMIQAAGLGIGVANTIEPMKPLCKVITENDNNHDAIKEIIEKYVLV